MSDVKPSTATAVIPSSSTPASAAAAAAIIPPPRAPPLPMMWSVDIDTFGSFQRALPRHARHTSGGGSAADGNYRMLVGATLCLRVPAGSLINQEDVTLDIETFIGNHLSIKGTHDALGSQTFEWTPLTDATGPATLSFSYTPFPAAAAPASSTTTTTTISTERRRGTSNKIIIEPRLSMNGVELPTSALSMQTVMSRCLGTMDEWVDKIKYATADLKYNMIHFTPVQVTGESGSCYSLADQLSLAPELVPKGSTFSTAAQGFEFLKKTIRELEEKCGIISTSDIVLNHTANNSKWLPDHPEAGYNEKNCPHLSAAIELDEALQELSSKIAKGHYKSKGVPPTIEDEQTLKAVVRVVEETILKPFKIHEWFTIDLDKAVKLYETTPTTTGGNNNNNNNMASCHHSIDARQAILDECMKTVGAKRNGVVPTGAVLRQHCKDSQDVRNRLKNIQEELYRKANETLSSVLNAVEGVVRYERLQCRKGPIKDSHWDSLVPRYFTPIKTKTGETLHLANNGWVMGWNAEDDFGAAGSLVYLNRSLIAWSDCVKLRFGDNPDACPFLWNLMAEYCKSTAEVFHGIRLDNCHSTPLEVAKFCLKECRKVNPRIWVYAELFTGNMETDLMFERELGINALIREALQSHNAKSLCHHIEEFGGERIGSLVPVSSISRLSRYQPLLQQPTISLFFDCTHDNDTPQQKRTAVDALPNAAAVAASPCAIGTCRGYDELVPKTLSVVTEYRMYHNYNPPAPPSPAMPASSSPTTTTKTMTPRFVTRCHPSATSMVVKGSWDGWSDGVVLSLSDGVWAADVPASIIPDDELTSTSYIEYQFKFVANERDWFHDAESARFTKDNSGNTNNIISFGIPSPSSPSSLSLGKVLDPSSWSYGDPLPGIMRARKILNDIHINLGMNEFTECSTSSYGDNVIVVTRHCPKTHQYCVFFIHTAFSPGVLTSCPNAIVDVHHSLKGKIASVLLEARLAVPENGFFNDEKDFINGLPSCLDVAVGHGAKGSTSSSLGCFTSRYEESIDTSTVTLTRFPPGSVLVIMTEGFKHVRDAVAQSITELVSQSIEIPGAKADRNDELQALGYLLYSCAAEERDRSRGARGSYDLGECIGELCYAGIAGVVPHLDEIRYTKKRTHPLVMNILRGDWIYEYTADRLDSDKDDAFSPSVVVVLLKISTWLREVFRDPLRFLPRELLVYYYDWIVSSLYSWVGLRLMQGVSTHLRGIDDPFVTRLCLASLQVYGFVPSSPLEAGTRHPSLSAGLPHFSTQYMRAWGRDTFIAYRGCFLVTGRKDEALDELIAFAQVMRHGLIPNLLDSQNNPRYNARDATWYFLQSIKDFAHFFPESTASLLDTKINFKYPHQFPNGEAVSTMKQLMHFILSSHYDGIQFREWNAGRGIDHCMSDNGFNINIKCDHTTGLILGGNKNNCGTWMDKMGSSQEGGNFGVPSTPRDGADIEIIGLLKSVLDFVVCDLNQSMFPYAEVSEKDHCTYARWRECLDNSIEEYFYIPLPEETQSLHVDLALAHTRGIYKDVLSDMDKGQWQDYQLRCNYVIALARCPDAFRVDHALLSLQQVSHRLFGAKTTSDMMKMFDDAVAAAADRDAFSLMKRFENNNINMTFPTIQLGLKTLDVKDCHYRPKYDNENRSSDPTMAAGASYHNGPEWVWPAGYFLEALYLFERASRSGQAINGVGGRFDVKSKFVESSHMVATYETMRHLLFHRQYIATDNWSSLPELTDDDGRYCRFSCQAQAWSIGCLLSFIELVASSSGSPKPTSSTSTATTPATTTAGTTTTSSATVAPSARKSADEKE